MKTTKYNPERRSWRGRSYRKGGTRVKVLRDRALMRALRSEY